MSVAAAISGFGQAGANGEFEVASVKRSQFQDERVRYRSSTNGLLDVANAPLHSYISFAYDLRSWQFGAGPIPLLSTRYDITAKASKPASGRELYQMLQGLLAARFGLKVHLEKREIPALVLTLVKSDAKSPAPTPSACVEIGPGDPLPIPTRGERPPPRCGELFQQVSYASAWITFNGGRIAMSTLAERLTSIFQQPVVDRTGFTDAFDIKVKFAAPDSLPGLQEYRTSGEPSEPADVPSIFAALPSAIGVRIDKGKATVDVLVIDSVRAPTEN